MRPLTGVPWDDVRALALPLGDYVIYGSGPLVAHGLLDRVGDVDVLARGTAWDRATRLGRPVRAPMGDQVVRLSGGMIEIFDGFEHFDIDAFIDRAALVDGLPFASLDDVVLYKQHLAREKDLEHVRLIVAHLGIR